MKKKHLFLRPLFILIACAAVGPMLNFPPASKAAHIVDRIVAIVNEDVISLTELNEALVPYENQIRNLGYPPEKEREARYQLRERLLNQLIDEKLAEQEIREAGIRVEKEEVDATMERIKKNRYLDDETLREELAEDGLTLEELRENIRKQILRAKLVTRKVKSKIVITDQDVKAYYESNVDTRKDENILSLRHILMRVPPGAIPENTAAVRERMETVLSKLEAGESFEALAERYSESTFAGPGGMLGEFSEDSLAPAIRNAVSDLSPGEHSGIVTTPQGLQILQVASCGGGDGESPEEAYPKIKEKLYNEIVNERFQTWVDSLREKAHIKIIR